MSACFVVQDARLYNVLDTVVPSGEGVWHSSCVIISVSVYEWHSME